MARVTEEAAPLRPLFRPEPPSRLLLLSNLMRPESMARVTEEAPPLLPLFKPEPPSRLQVLSKPMRPEKFGEFFRTMQVDLLEGPAQLDCVKFYGEVKYDGHSVLVAVKPNDTFWVRNRTKKDRDEFLTGNDASNHFTPLALELGIKFMAEACALYEGREAGFLEVPAARKLFLQNGKQNEGPCKLVFRIFSVVSVKSDGVERSGEDLTFTQTQDLLDRCIKSSSTLFLRAEHSVYRAWLYEDDTRCMTLRFEEKGLYPPWRSVALNPQDFHKFLLAKADTLECEGFVLKKGRHGKPVTDSNGILRLPWMVKAKREFRVQVVACLVVWGLEDRIKERKIWLYRKETIRYHYGPEVDYKLVFAGDATDHAFIKTFFRNTEQAFFYSTKAEKAALLTLDTTLLQTEPDRFAQLSVTCTNFSKTHFHLIGVKNDARRVKLGIEYVTDTEEMAMSHAHFRSTKLASDRLAEMLERHSKAKVERKRAVKDLSPPPPRLRAAYHAPTKQDASVGPDAPEVPEPVEEPQAKFTPWVFPTSVYLQRLEQGLNPRTGAPY